MGAPRSEIVHKRIQNPHASAPLIIPILVLSNTPEEKLLENIRYNSALALEWASMRPAHYRIAVLVGGGPSVNEELGNIRSLRDSGATIFAMNAASQWLRRNGIEPDYQVICDAKPETSSLVDANASGYLFASQVDPSTIMQAVRAKRQPILWHLGDERIEDEFPDGRRKRGGYALVGGGAAVGNSACCLAYVLGYRDLHLFGFDSSHKNGESHAYSQPMNRFIPTVECVWAGRAFTSSVAMKAQAEKFQITAQMLKKEGCKIEVYGDGLLQHMYRTPLRLLSERDKYKTLWQSESYREHSPGEVIALKVEKFAEKPGPVIDFGCGAGRAGLRLASAGYETILVDFADNCRDEEALSLPFLEWDLSQACPLRAPYGLCTDVMEHIPTDEVENVIASIMGSAGKVLFQISTVPDKFGALIGATLHNTVKDHSWWADKFSSLGFHIESETCGPISSMFLVISPQTKG